MEPLSLEKANYNQNFSMDNRQKLAITVEQQSAPKGPSALAMGGSPNIWGPAYSNYTMHGQSALPSPSISNNSLSPVNQFRSPRPEFGPVPTSSPLFDTSQMMLPGHLRKRRDVTTLLNSNEMFQGASFESTPPMQFLRRVSVPKIPVSPQSKPSHYNPKAKTHNLILPCFFDQNNNLRVHGPPFFDKAAAGGYWDASRQTIQSFLDEAASIDEENITIIEVKQLLRRYSINATGKKTVLMERIRRLQEYLKVELQRQQDTLVRQAAQSLISASPKLTEREAK